MWSAGSGFQSHGAPQALTAKAGFGGGSQEDAVVLQDSSDDSDSDELGGRVDNAV